MSERRDWEFHAKLADQLARMTEENAREAHGLALQARAIAIQMRSFDKLHCKPWWKRVFRRA